MRSKKGLTEADWAMSMGIFLLYLAWFFLVIKPTFSPETKESLPFEDLKDSFYSMASWDLNRTPLVIRSNVTSPNSIIIVDFPFIGSASNYYLDNTYFSVDEGRLFFLTPLSSQPGSNTKVKFLYHSAANYTLPQITSDLASSEETTSTGDLIATFDSSLPQQVFFMNGLKIKDYSISIDGNPLSTSSSSHHYTKILSKHKIIAPELNHSTYIFLDNAALYNELKSAKTKHVRLSFTLDRYHGFYIDPSTGGSINYNQTGCDSYTTDLIDFFDSDYGLAILFDQDVELEFCHEGELEVTADFDFKGSSSYRMIFHDTQTDAEILRQPYEVIWGMDQSLTGLSDQRLIILNYANYSYLRSNFDYTYDFRITVMNSTKSSMYVFGIEPPQRVTAGGKVYNTVMLDKYGNQTPASVSFVSW